MWGNAASFQSERQNQNRKVTVASGARAGRPLGSRGLREPPSHRGSTASPLWDALQPYLGSPERPSLRSEESKDRSLTHRALSPR